MLISLIGLPGGGKSTVGRHLSRRLQSRFVDSDTEIEKRIGRSIREFFAEEGEDRFRNLEQEVIAELSRMPNGVLATGGGAVLREANRKALHDRSTVIYLRSTPDELYRRLRHDTQRPLLQVTDPLGKLRSLHAQRDPLYQDTAHFLIETGRPSVPTLVNHILMQLEMAGVLPDHVVPSLVDGSPPAA